MLFFPYKMRLQDGTGKLSKAAGARWRFCPRIMVGLSSNRFYIDGSNSEISTEILNSEFPGRRGIWWSWRVTSVAPRIVLDVSFEIRLHQQSHFSWQVQYLVSLADESCCSAHCTWRFIWDDQSSESFFVAAIFGEVGGCLLSSAHCTGRFICDGDIWWSWSVIFCGRRSTS